VAEAARDRLRGRMEVLFVLPDYHRDFPRACNGRLGPPLHRRRARRPDAPLPRRPTRSPTLRFENVRDRSVGDICATRPRFKPSAARPGCPSLPHLRSPRRRLRRLPCQAFTSPATPPHRSACRYSPHHACARRPAAAAEAPVPPRLPRRPRAR
jgi:pyrroloquinoline quinone biosynthesis protein E